MAKKDPPNTTIKVAEGIYRRNGRYFVRVMDPVTKTRPQQYPPEFGHDNTLSGAKRLKAELEAKRDRAGSGRSETCDSFAGRWMRDFPTGPSGKPRAESTRIHNRERVAAFGRDFAGRLLADVDRREGRAWILGGEVPEGVRETAAGWAESKVLRDGSVVARPHLGNHQAVRAMFNDARSDGLVDENPFENLRLPQSRGRKDIFVLTDAELEKLVEMAHVVHGPYGVMYSALILTAAWTGIRPGELFAIRWSDLGFDAQEMRVREQFNSKTGKYGLTKNSFPRTVVLPPPAVEVLRGLPRQMSDDFVFRTMKGMPYSGRMHHYTWDPLRKAFVASLPETHHLRQRLKVDPKDAFDFYELRHFCATRLLDMGLTPADVGLQLGHRDGGKLVMSTYGHQSEDAARDRIRQAFRRKAVA